MQGIYCIEHLESGRKYYGSSMNVEKRLSSHKKQIINKTHHNIQLQRAVDKHGLESFMFYLVEQTAFLTQQELLNHEQTYLNNNTSGFNMAPANGGDILSNHPNREEIVEKIRQAIIHRNSLLSEQERKKKYGHPKEKNGMFGKTHSPEVCEKIRHFNTGNTYAKGIIRSEEFRKKISNAMKGNLVGEKNPFYGKHHSEKTKEILREKMSGDNSWIKNIDPAKLPYTKKYQIIYADGSSKVVFGLKSISIEFKISIAAVYATIQRISKGILPKRGALADVIIREVDI